ncbi:MAG: methionine--tRNA ligase [Desulfosalsimonas sp.]|uniref:methionine--tRNA ligase n=1 Tax=Desulfosalsimonas sp. TaxID=3073848 RepID=UPI003970933C
MTSHFYITTPIYYVNAKPHLGHTYTTIAADVARRFHRMQGKQTFFLTGTDEHGDKIVKAAEAGNEDPKTYADRISGLFTDLWPQLNIHPDYFIRTTDADHIAVVQQVLQNIYDSGDIYFSEYEGLYCFDCERFFTERELEDGKCPDHGKPPVPIRESNYFFKMSRYQQWLIDYIHENPDFIVPERYKNEVLGFLREPLEDLCISRPKSRLTWGITLPFDDNYVTYVWFDALINYISALGYPDGEKFKTFWPHVRHVVAKDILKPHGIYWPIMLKAAGIAPYRHLFVHGYWNVDESKMSKSLGNVVDPVYLKDTYGVDAIRYFLMREMTFGLDSSFSEAALIQRINSDLANDLGNLFSRVLAMFHKYFKGTVPEWNPEAGEILGTNLKAGAKIAIDTFCRSMENLDFHKGLAAVWEYIGQMNKFVDTSAPWELAKQDDGRPQLQEVICHLLEGLRVVAGLIYPVMPETAATMHKHLGRDPEAKPGFYLVEEISRWGVIAPQTVLPKGISLFPRLDAATILNRPARDPAPEKKKFEPMAPQIGIEEFARVDLRAARVISAEKVAKADKLLKLEVDIGHETRTVVAGIAKLYAPEDLVGKTVILVANLKPAKLMGIRSEGMVLAAVDQQDGSVAVIDRPVPPGTRLK